MTTLPKTRPARIQIQRVWPMLDCGRYPVKRTLGDERRRLGATSSATATTSSRAAVRYRPPGARRWLEAPMEPIGNDRWHGSFAADRLGRWQYTIVAWVDRSPPGGGSSSASSRPARPTWRASWPRGPRSLGVDVADARAGARPALAPKPDRARRDVGPAARADRRPRARPLRRAGTSSSRARGAASPASRSSCPARRARLRRRLPAADPPDRPHAPQGPEQRARRPARTIPAARGRSAAPEGGHTAVAPRARHDRRLRPPRRARRRSSGIEIALDFAIQCSPDHPWLERAPGVVPPPPRRDAQVRREPAQALPGHLQRQLRLARTGEGLWAALRDVVLLWVGHGVRVFRVDNPHTKPVAVLGVADPRGAGRAPRRRLPRRGVHPARR